VIWRMRTRKRGVAGAARKQAGDAWPVPSALPVQALLMVRKAGARERRQVDSIRILRRI
jgi:hypothetical protein